MTVTESRLDSLGGNPPEIIIPRVNLQLKETEYDGITYVCPSWEQMGAFNFNLAKQIIESGQPFDRLVALARGGWTWARDIADALKIPEISSVRIKTYTGVNESEEPKIVQPLTDAVYGERILLFDEVIDSGVTIKKGQKYLRVMGAQSIQTAALCYKPRSEIKPEFFAFETSAWVVFPHEIREFVDGSIDKWRSDGMPMDKIMQRLSTIGVTSEQIDFYISQNLK
jgi:hypoxanthine phosphoribosyltransferase